MATPTNISPANGYFIAQQNTTTGITPLSNAAMATIVAAPITAEVGVGEQVLYVNTGVVGFKQGDESYQIIPIDNILLTYTGAPS